MNPRAFSRYSAQACCKKKKLCAGRLWVATCDVTSFLRMDSTVLQGFGHSRGLRCGMAHRQADQQTETALTDAHTTSLARCWAGLRPRRNADSRPQTDGQTNRCTDRFTDARTAQHSPLLFFLCRGRRSCVFSARTIVVPPPPPLSAQAGGSHPCVVWSLQHCLLRRWITWRWAALLPRPCIALVLISICLFPPCTCPKLIFRMAAVKVAHPLLSFLHLLAGWPACGSSIPAHTPQVWRGSCIHRARTVRSFDIVIFTGSVPPPHSNSDLSCLCPGSPLVRMSSTIAQVR